VTAARDRSPSASYVALGYAGVALAASSWGTWPLILRTAERTASISPALESTILMAVIFVGSGVFVLNDRVARKATTLQWLGIAWLGVGDALNDYFFFAAYQKTSVAVAVLSHYLAPLFVALSAPFLLRERPTVRTYAAVAVAFFGLVLLLRPWSGAARPGDAVGALFGATSAVFYASNVLVNKRLGSAFSASELMFFHCFVALPVLAAMVPHAEWHAVNARAASVVAVGSLGPGILGGMAFVWGLRRVPASHAGALTLLEPLVAVMLGAAVYGEGVGLTGFWGAALILTGAVLVVLQRGRAEPAEVSVG
jgi:drug/metabolite transporter (DMT)-like permease